MGLRRLAEVLNWAVTWRGHLARYVHCTGRLSRSGLLPRSCPAHRLEDSRSYMATPEMVGHALYNHSSCLDRCVCIRVDTNKEQWALDIDKFGLGSASMSVDGHVWICGRSLDSQIIAFCVNSTSGYLRQVITIDPLRVLRTKFRVLDIGATQVCVKDGQYTHLVRFQIPSSDYFHVQANTLSSQSFQADKCYGCGNVVCVFESEIIVYKDKKQIAKLCIEPGMCPVAFSNYFVVIAGTSGSKATITTISM